MFCIVAFVVLAILGIFSASNRQLAKEAFDCVGRRVTLRPCNTGFDEKMKAKLLGVVITRSEGGAMFLNKHFELLSWIFFVAMMASTVWAVRGVYLFYVTGSCNGANSAAFCVFDPTGSNNQVSATTTCQVHPTTIKDLTLKGVDLSQFPVLNPDSPKKIVFVGCYACDFTRKSYPMIRQLVEKSGASLTFLEYPVKTKSDVLARVSYCVDHTDSSKLWALNDALFSQNIATFEEEASIRQTVTGIGLDADKIMACVNDPKTEDAVQARMKEIVKTKFFGTPTIFIDGQVLVGPKPYRVYGIALEGLFYWLK
jgi:protein-disulfide isomerase